MPDSTNDTKKKFRRGDIVANQKYLKKWDDYQLDWLNSDAFDPNRPILLPITVNIGGGIVQRRRIKVPQLQTIMDGAQDMAMRKDVQAAYQSYYDYFAPKDGSQSGTPPTPLDFAINCPVIHVFHLPRDNWTFTDHTQYSVDNVPSLCGPKQGPNDLFEVLGVSPDGHTLFVKNNNWAPDQDYVDRLVAETPESKQEEMILPKLGKFRMKYNLHVSIAQTIDDKEMRTDIIIDPGSNANDGTQGNN